MGTSEQRDGGPGKGSVRLALRHYGGELVRLRRVAVPALLLPALGNIGIQYLAPLVVAKLVGRVADGDRTSPEATVSVSYTHLTLPTKA